MHYYIQHPGFQRDSRTLQYTIASAKRRNTPVDIIGTMDKDAPASQLKPSRMVKQTSDKAPRTQDVRTLRKRGSRANLAKALAILRKAGKGNPPMPGDEW